MDFVGLVAILAGVYLLMSSGTNRKPGMLGAILKDPKNARAIIANAPTYSLPTNADVFPGAYTSQTTTGGAGSDTGTASGAGSITANYDPNRAGGKVLPNHKGWTGMNPDFLARVQAWAAETGVTYKVTGNGGPREFSDQQRAHNLYKMGKGPLAAKPGTSAHEAARPGGSVALDVNPWPSPAAIAKMGKHGIGLTVPGEPWHIGNLRK